MDKVTATLRAEAILPRFTQHVTDEDVQYLADELLRAYKEGVTDARQLMRDALGIISVHSVV